MGNASQRMAGLLKLALDALLLVAFVLQSFLLGCLLIRGHLPLPTEWMNQRLLRQLPEGISGEAAAYRLYADGSLQVESLALRVAPHELPVVTAEQLNLKAAMTISGPLKLKSLSLSGGRFYIPAVYAPDGIRGPLLEGIAARLHPGAEGLTIDSFAATFGNLSIRGSAQLPILQNASAGHVDARAFLPQLFSAIQPVLRETPLLQHLSAPALHLAIQSGKDGQITATGRLTGQELNYRGIVAEDLALSTTLNFTDGKWDAVSATLIEAATVSSEQPPMRGKGLRALLQPGEWAALTRGEWPELQVAADSLTIAEREWQLPQLDLSLQALPTIHFSGTTGGLNGALELSGRIDLDARSGELSARGQVELPELMAPGPNSALPELIFDRMPYCTLAITLGEDFALQTADVRAQLDSFSVNGIGFDHLQARGSYRQGQISFPEIYLSRAWQWLDLGLHYDLSSRDYRVRLIGSAKPDDYNAILPRWWAAIFKDFDFESVSDAHGDFIVYGNTAERAAKLFFGKAHAGTLEYRGVRIEEGSLFVRGRGPYAEIFKMDLQQPDGWTRGSIRFCSRLDDVPGPLSIHLDLQTRMRIDEAKQLFDDEIAALLNDFEAAYPVEATLRGAIFNDAYPGFAPYSFVDIQTNSARPLRFKGIALDDLRFDLFGRNDVTHLRNLQSGFAGGRINAAADLTRDEEDRPRIRLQGHLHAADPSQIEDFLQMLSDRKDDDTIAQERAGQGRRFDAELHAQGPVEDLYAFSGFGHFRLENETLGQIQLFGPISTLLQRARIGYTSFRLDTMEGSFAIEGERLQFNDLRIDGPQTRMDATGVFGLLDQSLDVRVSVYLFGNAGNPDSPLRQLQQWVSQPLPNLLEFQLSGTLEEQRWRSLYDPRNLLLQPLNIF